MFNPRRDGASVSIIGVGNTGSAVAINLARLGIKDITLYDFDDIEPHNLTSQQYDVNDLGKPKVEALAEKLRAINPDIEVNAVIRIVTGAENFENQVVLVAVDTMEGRRGIAKKMMEQEKSKRPKLIIDGRIGGNQLEVYTCGSVSGWKKTFVDNPATDPCGGRFICYVSSVVGGIITNQIKRYVRKQKLKKSIMMSMDTFEVITNYNW